MFVVVAIGSRLLSGDAATGTAMRRRVGVRPCPGSDVKRCRKNTSAPRGALPPPDPDGSLCVSGMPYDTHHSSQSTGSIEIDRLARLVSSPGGTNQDAGHPAGLTLCGTRGAPAPPTSGRHGLPRSLALDLHPRLAWPSQDQSAGWRRASARVVDINALRAPSARPAFPGHHAPIPHTAAPLEPQAQLWGPRYSGADHVDGPVVALSATFDRP